MKNSSIKFLLCGVVCAGVFICMSLEAACPGAMPIGHSGVAQIVTASPKKPVC